MEITLETIYQAAKESNLCTMDAITMMQAGAASIGDEATLDRLCYIKEQLIDLGRNGV